MSTERVLALRHVARTPLTQAMGVLWLIAAAQLLARLPEGALHIKWPVGVGLAAGTALLLLASQRWLQLAAVPALLGLVSVLAFSHHLGVDTVVGFGTVAAAYALVLWQLTSSALAHPASGPVVRGLRLAGGHGAHGGRALVESAVHWSGFAIAVAIVLLAPIVLLASAWRLVPTEPAPWPMLLLPGAFFLLTGWRYELRLHAYAFLVCVLLGVWLACALVGTPGTSLTALPASPEIAIWTVGLSAALSSIALAIDRAGRSQTVTRVRSVYRVPLRAFALGLAVMVVAQRLAAGGDAPGVVLLAGCAILYADHARPRFLWSFAGTLVAWLSLHALGLELLAPGQGAPGAAYEALVLAALALAMAGSALVLRRHGLPGARYAGPVHLNAAIAFVTAVVVAAQGLAGPAPGDPPLTLALALLVAAAFPLLAPLSKAGQWRGLAVPVLLSALFVSVLAGTALGLTAVAHATLAWGFVLWLGGNLLVSLWSRVLPAWPIGAAPWPWLGLVFVMAGATVLVSDPDDLWLGLAGASAYLYLLVRNSASAVFPWLAGGTLVAAGLALWGWWIAPLAAGGWEPLTAATMLASLAWLNLVLAAIPAWRRYGPRLSERLALRRRDLDRPLCVFAGLGLVSTLGALVALACAWMAGTAVPFEAAPGLAVPALGLALAASFAHANAVSPHRAFAHGLVLSLLAVVVVAQMLTGDPRHVPAAIALCAVAALAVRRLRLRSPSPGAFARPIDAVLTLWLAALPVLAAALALTYPPLSIGERLAVLGMVLVNAVGIGWWQRSRLWLSAAIGLVLALEHGLWLMWLPVHELARSLPWTALTGVANVVLVLWLAGRLERALDADAAADAPDGSSRQDALRTLRDLLENALPVIVGLTVLELVAHGALVASAVAAGADPRWLSGGDPFAAVAAWAVLGALSLRTAYRRGEGRWVHAAALLGGAGAAYLRVVLFGLAAPGVLDTAVLIGAAYLLLALQRLTLSTPAVSAAVMQVCMALPLLALATLPAQLGSAHAGGALMAIAVLYLLIRARTRNPLPLYLGVLALNASAYLWVPLWADRLGMFQLYVLPATLSVLVVLHLHRRELRPSVLNGARLAALVTLYCGAAVDVFVRPGLAMFALALGLSVASVVVGIALRIRAFLYAGVAFLVLNVGFQLVQLYPEQRLGRAILLIVLGVAITGAMIGFNIKREAILNRVRIMRADLDTWE